jgi:FlaA1/EpsC-like NDP-sugar epimerase
MVRQVSLLDCAHQTHLFTSLACKLQVHILKRASHLRQVCLVTGGNGFVGQNLVTKLVKDGTWKVVIFDIAPDFLPNDEIKGVHLVSEGLASGHVEYIRGDLRKKEQVVAGEQNLFVTFRVGR